MRSTCSPTQEARSPGCLRLAGRLFAGSSRGCGEQLGWERVTVLPGLAAACQAPRKHGPGERAALASHPLCALLGSKISPTSAGRAGAAPAPPAEGSQPQLLRDPGVQGESSFGFLPKKSPVSLPSTSTALQWTQEWMQSSALFPHPVFFLLLLFFFFSFFFPFSASSSNLLPVFSLLSPTPVSIPSFLLFHASFLILYLFSNVLFRFPISQPNPPALPHLHGNKRDQQSAAPKCKQQLPAGHIPGARRSKNSPCCIPRP